MTTPQDTDFNTDASLSWDRCLVYGAYGYTGELIARLCHARGFTPVLAGRSAEKLAPLATELGMASTVVGLDDPARLDAALAEIDVVLHCAGPFARTSKSMVDACIRTGTHYLDITGEVPVFEAISRRSAEAETAGVMLMPGTGFDVVPTDCMASYLKAKMPSATSLSLAFKGVGGGLSHGTATTAVENMAETSARRRNGRLVPVRSGSQTRNIDFGRGPVHTMGIPWGDISTAWHSTGIPNIEVFVAVPPSLRRVVLATSFIRKAFGLAPVQRFMKARIKSRPAGPSPAALKDGFSLIWGRVEDGSGASAEARMKTAQGYQLTALASLNIAARVLAGHAPIGYQTPSSAYGADLIMDCPGTERADI